MGWWFGRILTFEVFADDRPVSVAEILGDASNRLVASDHTQEVIGYAAYGQSTRSAIQPLVDCYAVELFDDGSRLISPFDGAVWIGREDYGNSADNQPAARIEREQTPASSLPSALRLGYYDSALDYQSGEARASSAERNRTEAQRELPAAVNASEAKSLAQHMIAREWARRDKLTLRLPPRYLDLQPGVAVDFDLQPRSWSVEQCTIDGFVVIAELRPALTARATVSADPGRIVANNDVVAADVTLALFDVPDVLDEAGGRPSLLLAATSPSPGWKRCATEIFAGQQILQAPSATRKSVLGRALTALPPGDPYLINSGDALEVELVDADQWLLSCDDDALVSGSNLAVLGSELIQFGSVEPLGEGRFRLGRLLRGRGGTEWATGSHLINEPFALIERDSLRAVPVPMWALGSTVIASVRNLSGTTSESVPLLLGGESTRPWSPVALQADFDANGKLLIAWTRRTRAPAAWIDEVDVPVGESAERYRVTITASLGSIEIEAGQPALQFPAAELGQLGPGSATLQVRQVGDAGVSRPAECIITI